MNQETYDKIIFQARISVEAGRSEETLEYMEQIIKNKEKDLTEEEKNLISVASKNILSSKRAAWRTLSGIEYKEKTNNSEKIYLVKNTKTSIERELYDICDKMIGFIDNFLIVKELNPESNVFYRKLKGDYLRYKAEISQGSLHNDIVQDCLNTYRQAYDYAKDLKANNPIKLGLALNYSVFYFEVLNNPVEAIKIANQAFNSGISSLESIAENQYKDATNILQLLKENITLWSNEVDHEDGEKE